MERILITGATGNVGSAVLSHFTPRPNQRVYQGTRHPDQLDETHWYFDLDHLSDTIATLSQVDTLFLLRPPQVADQAIFRVLTRGAREFGVKHIVFLSVQGADRAPFIPHAKIEKLIRESGIPYTFVRPSYFMDNLITEFGNDIRDHQRIFVPAGNAKFLWVDVADVGKAIAEILKNVDDHQNQVYTITGGNSELLSFSEATEILSQELNQNIRFVSPSVLRFFLEKRRKGVSASFIAVMIMLHYTARFQQPPTVHQDLPRLIGDAPRTLRTFVRAHVSVWQAFTDPTGGASSLS